MAGLLSQTDLARVGSSTAPVTEQVTRRDLKRYAMATRQTLPKYVNGDEAPPLFHTYFFDDFPSLEALEPSGSNPDLLISGLPLVRRMAGGCGIVYHAPIRAGDTLTAVRTLTHMEEKQAKSGPLIVCNIEIKITNQDGNPVVTENFTRLLR